MRVAPLVRPLAVPLALLVAFWSIAIGLARALDAPFLLFNFGYIGTSVALGMGLYATLPRARKALGRRLALVLVGGYMLGYVGLGLQENVQLEGFFSYLLAGFFSGSLIHCAVAKVFGPLLWGRGWCGWACWTAMVLDLLPWTQSPGRVASAPRGLRSAHFAASLGLVAALWVAGYRVTSHGAHALAWLVAGNALYFGAGIGLAALLRDNRAFCKHLCPVTVPLRAGSRFSLLKVAGDASACTGCGACTKQCPMDVRVPDYVRAGERVLSTECVFCQSCITACPKRALRLSFGLDASASERLRLRGEPCARPRPALPRAA